MNDSIFYKSLRAIAAGICISIGCICYASTENPIAGAILFSVGLLAIIEYDLNLFTGKIGLVKSLKDTTNAIVYLIMNVLGCIMVSIIVSMIPRLNDVSNRCNEIANIKMSYSVIDMFVTAIFCGVLMLFATKHKNNKLLTVMCVAVFIICGFEHSIADSFYLMFYGDVIKSLTRVIILAIGNAIGSIGMNQLIDGMRQ